MEWTDVRWPIRLTAPPSVSVMAFGHHRPGPIDRYQIRGLWCLHLYRYRGTICVGGQTFPLLPGHAGVTPPGAVLEFEYGADPAIHAFAHFALPRGRGAESIPAMQNLGAQFETLYAAMEQAINWMPVQPSRAAARLWDLLWQLAGREGHDAAGQSLHPAVREAVKQIELRLAEPIGVAELAEEVGLSRNHLTRLFQSALASNVVGYIRRRRVERARHLLTHSTRPIKSIAAEVGIPDLQLFNKTLRRTLGVSPRKLRR